jgi:hypothetical protein
MLKGILSTSSLSTALRHRSLGSIEKLLELKIDKGYA